MEWRDVCFKMGERWGYRDGVLTLPGLTIRVERDGAICDGVVREGEFQAISIPAANPEFVKPPMSQTLSGGIGWVTE
jgi:hypothetical protein